MNIDYRHYKPDDYPDQRKLFELSFPETSGTSIIGDAHYKWKFESFPHRTPSYQYVASEPEELVGYYAAIPYQYQINKKIYSCGMVCDVMTHPDRRGKGIFTKIGHYSTSEMKNQELAFTTGYPIRPEVIPGHMKVGWKIVHQMPMYLRVVGVKTLLPKPLRLLAPLINPFVSLFSSPTLIPMSGYTAVTFSREDFLKNQKADHALFLEKWLAEQDNALIKSLDFLEWRTGAPESIYQFVVLKKDHTTVGLSIVRPTTLKGVESLAVLDFMILKDHFHASKAIHQALWQIAKEFNKDVVVCMASSNWAKNYHFFGSLYVKTPAIFSLIVKKLDDQLGDEFLFIKEKWHLFWIDSDDV